MQEWYEYAHLEHVQEFLVKRFSNHVAEGHRSIVEYFNFVLINQEWNGYSITDLMLLMSEDLVHISGRIDAA